MTDSPDGRTHRERVLAGEEYIADDPQLLQEMLRAWGLCAEFNATPPGERWREILHELFARFGQDSYIRPPLYCDYGYQITSGARSFANLGLVALDVAKIVIGDDVQIEPNVQLLTPTHPLDADRRRAKWEGAQPITIGNNVWLGGGVIVLPGVTIGENTVVGAGSIVTKDLPAGVLAVGNPVRVLTAL